MTDQRNPPEAELARLADGSLPASRQAELRAQVQRSPELTAALAEQERAVSMLRALDAPAPAALRARLDELTDSGHARRPALRWPRALVLPVATAFAVVVAAVVILAGGGGTTAPTVPQTARLALAAATLPAPSVDAAHPGRLSMQAAGIPFPDWGPSTGWTTSGARTDKVGGRMIATVFYTGRHGARVGYAIVSGSALRVPRGAGVTRYGVRFTLRRQGSARLITWLRDGHTCVIAGRSVSYATLLALAGADGHEAFGSQAALHLTHSRAAYL